jgi:two-component system sensor kinase FixL
MRSLRTIVASRPLRLTAGLAGIALIAYADLSLSDDIPLALLYLAPVMVMSSALRRWQIPLLGLLCTLVAEYADAYPWTVQQGVPRDALYFFAYTAAGLYVSEILSRRRSEQTHLAELEAEIEARRGAEEQLSLVVEKSSIAIVTTDDSGTILQANEAAERMFAQEDGVVAAKLQGSSLNVFLPALARVQIRRQGWEHLKTNLQCQGMHANQDAFLADVWVSSYVTTRGGRLTAMIVDSSIDARDREEANLEQVMAGSKLAIGALFHEIRNICAAISVVQQNLRTAYAAGEASEDFDALQQLVTALERMASLELSLVKREPARVKLDGFLRELRIILNPSLRENSIALHWQVGAGLPEVWADQQSLLQVFLNLVRNAEKALAAVEHAELTVATSRVDGRVRVTLSDNGPGVSRPDQLFRPFGSSANASGMASGLGLYLSRAMMMSFHGDLLYEASERGATFVVQMVTAEAEA